MCTPFAGHGEHPRDWQGFRKSLPSPRSPELSEAQVSLPQAMPPMHATKITATTYHIKGIPP
eukprot:2688167-Prymnesium_polylepis.1